MARCSGIAWLLASCLVCAPALAEPPPKAEESAPSSGPPVRRERSAEPVLFVSEGLDGVLSVPDLRARLASALGRELVSLADAGAHRAQATIWMAFGKRDLVLRVTPPHRPEVWRELLRSELGPDPVSTVVKAVLEMFWAERFARLDAKEIQDPFCPPGLICVDAERGLTWPPVPEAEVLDPWDSSYQTFYGWEPSAYSRPAGGTAPAAGQALPTSFAPWSRAAVLEPRRQQYALNFLGGGGVHGGGAFFRYEVDAVSRFPRFDFGFAFVGARGQPEPPNKARRAVAVLLERRFVADAFELDLGASFGAFFATFEEHEVEVRPYLRGAGTFALPVGRVFDLLVRSELATTIAKVHDTGAVEYALALGLRHRM